MSTPPPIVRQDAVDVVCNRNANVSRLHSDTRHGWFATASRPDSHPAIENRVSDVSHLALHSARHMPGPP